MTPLTPHGGYLTLEAGHFPCHHEDTAYIKHTLAFVQCEPWTQASKV